MRLGTQVSRLRRDGAGSKRLPFSIILIMLTLSLILCSLISYWVLFARNVFHSVPISLHSILTADYQVDPRELKFFPIRFSIIPEVIADQFGQEASERLATVPSEVFLPTLTMTPSNNQDIGLTPVATLNEITKTPTFDAQVPTITPSPIFTTNPPKITPTPTLILLNSLTPTPTQKLPTTPTPTWWLKTPTATSVIPTQPIQTSTQRPTSTWVPTSTPTPAPTKTSTKTLVPPSSTPRPTNTQDPYPGPSPNPTIDPYP